jgi:hypothetical protein
MMPKNAAVISVVSIIAAIALVEFGAWSLQNSKENYSGQMESITIGNMHIEGSALIYIADDQRFLNRMASRR